MGRGVVCGLAFVGSGSNDDAVINDKCANRNIAMFSSKACLFKGYLRA